MKQFLAFASVLALLALSASAEEAKKEPRLRPNFATDDKTVVHLVGLETYAPDDPEGEEDGQGLSLSFSLERKDRVVLKLDDEKSRILMLTDDLGGDMLGKPDAEEGEKAGLSQQEKVDASGHRLTFQVTSARTPLPGATRILMNADLTLVCGADEKTADPKPLALKKGAGVEAGPWKISVTEVKRAGDEPKENEAKGDEAKPQVEEGDQPLAGVNLADFQMRDGRRVEMALGLRWPVVEGKQVRSIRFFDKNGAELDSETWDQDAGAEEGAARHIALFPRAADEVTLRVRYFDRVEEVVVPVRMSAGVGF